MKNYLLLLTVLFFMSFSCEHKETENAHYHVKITNNEEYAIYAFGGWGHDADPEYSWLVGKNKTGTPGKQRRINPGKTSSTAISNIPPSTIEGDFTVYDLLEIVFVNASIYDEIPIGSIIPDNVLLGVKTYDLETLQELDFHIYYPFEDE